jgi:hypothetical protein
VPLVDGYPGSEVFYSASDILDFARVLVNDAQGGISGQDLADDRPYTWPLLNLCYGRLANWLEDNNVESAMYAEAVIQLPTTATYSDPNAQSRLGYDGFTDAAGNFYDSPTLPPDLLQPLNLWQRITGLSVPFCEMKQQLGGLGNAWNYGWSGGTYGSVYGPWEFRQNSIYLLGGAYQGTDLRLRYIPSVVELTKPVGDQPSPVIWFAKAGEALAYMVAAEFAEIRNAPNAAILRAKADKELEIIANRSAKRENRTQTRKRGYGFGRRRASWL